MLEKGLQGEKIEKIILLFTEFKKYFFGFLKKWGQSLGGDNP